jgi:N-acetylmuramoyl-L-alanine amidase
MGKTSNRKVAQLKQDILRGVYEQNLQSLGKGPARVAERVTVRLPPPERTRYRSLIPMVAFFMAMGVLAYPGLPGQLRTQGGAGPDPRVGEAHPNTGAVSTPRSGRWTAHLTDDTAMVKGAGLLLPTAERANPILAALHVPDPPESAPPGPAPDPKRLGTPFLRAELPLKEVFGLGAKIIVIDPGHGGKDPGATASTGVREKDVTLDVARRLRDKLIARGGYKILMTRDDDSTVALKRRVEFSNSMGADLFISIHVNSLPEHDLNVVETYYFGPNSDNKSLRLAEQENDGSGYRFSEFKEIVQKLGDTMKLQESRTLALAIQDSLYHNMQRRNRAVRNLGIKTAPFVVLLGVDAPSVLVEISCLSNVEEARKLDQESYRDEIAGYLANGITNYLDPGTDKGDMRYGTGRLAAR